MLTTRELSTQTWGDFERLFTQGSGWDFCGCMYFHRPGHLPRAEFPTRAGQGEANRRAKRALVEQGRAHGILVYVDNDPVGWCQFGAVDELPLPLGDDRPDWRITCFVTHKRHRRKGVAEAELRGALDAIGRAGGGVVEAYPIVTTPVDVPGTGLVEPPRGTFGNVSTTGTLGMFEREGFAVVGAARTGQVRVRRSLRGLPGP